MNWQIEKLYKQNVWVQPASMFPVWSDVIGIDIH